MIGIKRNEEKEQAEPEQPNGPTGFTMPEENEDWFSRSEYEGQLAVDVYQTENAIIIKSPIAGVVAEDIDISINGDMVTIRGRRQSGEKIPEKDYLFQECYWGGFSRSIILPTDVQADKVQAEMKNGVLIVKLPKAKAQSVRVIPVVSKDE